MSLNVLVICIQLNTSFDLLTVYEISQEALVNERKLPCSEAICVASSVSTVFEIKTSVWHA